MKPSIPKGTRDFSPSIVAKRHYIFDRLKSIFKKYGFVPLETPTMENLSTLTGKYGDEGDQLLYKVLNSGDFLNKVTTVDDYKKLTPLIAEKGLRYDLTIPFARYVVMNQHDITFPFKRYQIQPVWRADRPQKGRYREFYQCDIDIAGTDSLICEVELLSIYNEGFQALGIPVSIKVNNRKVFQAMAEIAQVGDAFMAMTIAIDKLDKIGADGVKAELINAGLQETSIATIFDFLSCQKIDQLGQLVAGSDIGMKGVAELQYIFDKVDQLNFTNDVSFDITLARGLNYYTGCIFEVKAVGVQMGSIGGGGRYDDLTGMFGLKGISGVGVSFGADRVYDVMEELQLFPTAIDQTLHALVVSMDGRGFDYAFKVLQIIRNAGISSEIYPDVVKTKKMFKYADDRKVLFTIIIGEEELTNQQVSIKNMTTGDQVSAPLNEILSYL